MDDSLNLTEPDVKEEATDDKAVSEQKADEGHQQQDADDQENEGGDDQNAEVDEPNEKIAEIEGEEAEKEADVADENEAMSGDKEASSKNDDEGEEEEDEMLEDPSPETESTKPFATEGLPRFEDEKLYEDLKSQGWPTEEELFEYFRSVAFKSDLNIDESIKKFYIDGNQDLTQFYTGDPNADLGEIRISRHIRYRLGAMSNKVALKCAEEAGINIESCRSKWVSPYTSLLMDCSVRCKKARKLRDKDRKKYTQLNKNFDPNQVKTVEDLKKHQVVITKNPYFNCFCSSLILASQSSIFRSVIIKYRTAALDKSRVELKFNRHKAHKENRALYDGINNVHFKAIDLTISDHFYEVYSNLFFWLHTGILILPKDKIDLFLLMVQLLDVSVPGNFFEDFSASAGYVWKDDVNFEDPKDGNKYLYPKYFTEKFPDICKDRDNLVWVTGLEKGRPDGIKESGLTEQEKIKQVDESKDSKGKDTKAAKAEASTKKAEQKPAGEKDQSEKPELYMPGKRLELKLTSKQAKNMKKIVQEKFEAQKDAYIPDPRKNEDFQKRAAMVGFGEFKMPKMTEKDIDARIKIQEKRDKMEEEKEINPPKAKKDENELLHDSEGRAILHPPTKEHEPVPEKYLMEVGTTKQERDRPKNEYRIEKHRIFLLFRRFCFYGGLEKSFVWNGGNAVSKESGQIWNRYRQDLLDAGEKPGLRRAEVDWEFLYWDEDG